MESKFAEYLGVFKKAVANLPNVIEGNLNYYKDQFNLLEPHKKAEASRRFDICSKCPFQSTNAKAMGFYETHRDTEHCTVCKCPIEKKVMSFDEDCGLSYIKETKNTEGEVVSGLEGFKPLWFVYNK